jgi:hypothetical protein
MALRRHTKLITQLKHPGYYMGQDDMCSEFVSNTMPQQRRYFESLETSKICLIGTALQLVDVCTQVI